VGAEHNEKATPFWILDIIGRPEHPYTSLQWQWCAHQVLEPLWEHSTPAETLACMRLLHHDGNRGDHQQGELCQCMKCDQMK
jgi:hypothetical protein